MSDSTHNYFLPSKSAEFPDLNSLLASIASPDKTIKFCGSEIRFEDWMPENVIVLLPKKDWLQGDTMHTYLERVWKNARVISFCKGESE